MRQYVKHMKTANFYDKLVQHQMPQDISILLETVVRVNTTIVVDQQQSDIIHTVLLGELKNTLSSSEELKRE